MQDLYKEVTQTLTEPWEKMVERKKKVRCTHWNAKLQMLWEAMQKARYAVRKSGIQTDRKC